MRILLQRLLIAAALLLAALYAYDYLSVQHRLGANKPGNRVEYALDAQSPMLTQSCVHSIFPHEGYTPCWYVNRMALRPTPMSLLPAARFF
jgi:hypothetical protein